MAEITGSVGANAKNVPADVKTVQSLLNRVPTSEGGPSAPLKVDGLCWQKTTSAIERFQKVGCGFKWPDRLVEPGRKTWTALNRYDPAGPPPAPPTEEQPKCGLQDPLAQSSFVQTGSANSFFVGKYLPVPLDAWQRSVARSVFGDSLDLDSIYVLYRKPVGAKGLCVVGPLPGQNTLMLCSSARELLIHELTHAWQSQHHAVAGKYMWNALQSQQLAKQKGESAYWYVPKKPFGEYGAEQIAEQVENGESAIVSHVRSRAVRFHDPSNIASLDKPRSQSYAEPDATHAPSKYCGG